MVESATFLHEILYKNILKSAYLIESDMGMLQISVFLFVLIRPNLIVSLQFFFLFHAIRRRLSGCRDPP